MSEIRTEHSYVEILDALYRRLSEMPFNDGSIYSNWLPLNEINIEIKRQFIDGWIKTDAMNCKSAKIKGILEWDADKLKVRKTKNVKDI